jgi:hypothetical protein
MAISWSKRQTGLILYFFAVVELIEIVIFFFIFASCTIRYHASVCTSFFCFPSTTSYNLEVPCTVPKFPRLHRRLLILNGQITALRGNEFIRARHRLVELVLLMLFSFFIFYRHNTIIEIVQLNRNNLSSLLI